MLKSPFLFLLSCFRGIYLGKIPALGRGNSNSIAAAAFLCRKHPSWWRDTVNFAERCSEWGEMWPPLRESTVSASWWLVSPVHWSHADNPSRKGLVSPLGNCRWSVFLTSLFITMSTKFSHSLAHSQNGRRHKQFCRDVFCPAHQLYISSF